MRTVKPRRVRMLFNGLAILALMLVMMLFAKPALAQTASVSGVVYADLNTNGSREAGEPGIENVTVQLRNAANSVVQQVTTNANGAYSFSAIAVGTYAVVETDPTGYVSTTPNSVEVVLAADQSATVNFGDLHTQTVTPPGRGYVWGYVLKDENRNGLVDPGELGLANFNVSIYDESGNLVGGPVVTDANGFYEFPDVLAGFYTVVATPPTGSKSTTILNSTLEVTSGELVTVVFPFVAFRLHFPGIVTPD